MKILDIWTIVIVSYTNIFSTPKGILISDIHCILHACYKNMPDLRTLYAIPSDVLITGIHCIPILYLFNLNPFLALSHQFWVTLNFEISLHNKLFILAYFSWRLFLSIELGYLIHPIHSLRWFCIITVADVATTLFTLHSLSDEGRRYVHGFNALSIILLMKRAT